MTEEAVDGPMAVLLTGLDAAELAAFVDAGQPHGSDNVVIHIVETLPEAVALIGETAVQCVFLARGGLPNAPGGWSTACAELVRVAPHAVLVAIADTPCDGEWDDVVTHDELEIRLLGCVLRSARAIARANARLVCWALRDPLTGVHNRRGLEQFLVRETSARDRGQGSLMALLVDCDDFKRVNDRFGLSTGDIALKGVADALVCAVRAGDTVARVGGDEFLILLPQTRTWEAVEIAERIRTQVHRLVELPDGEHVSVSIGVGRLEVGISDLGAVLAATQAGLSLSKGSGKDQIQVVQGHPTDPDLSLPPDSSLVEFTRRTIVAIDGETTVGTALDVAPGSGLAVQRAAHPAWDLHWFRVACRQIRPEEPVVHVRLFPSTLREVPPATVLAAMPDGCAPGAVVFAIDEDYLSGDAFELRARLAPFRDLGVGLSIEVADFSGACVESMVLLEPQTVRVGSVLVAGLSGRRGSTRSLARFVQVSEALGIEVIADGGDASPEDRQVAASLGVRYWVLSG